MKYILFLVTLFVAFNTFSQTTPLCFSEPKYRGVGVNPQFITSGDFNNDGFADIVATSRYLNDSITVLLNSGNGITYTRNNYLVGIIPERVITADFNSDGNLDLAVATNSTLSGTSISLVNILIGSPLGIFSTATSYTVSGNSTTLVTGYFNGDGIMDLSVGGNMNIDFLNGNGDGTFSQSYRITSQFVVSPYDMIGHDFNSDGKTDLAFIDNAGGGFNELIIYLFGYTLPSLPISLGTTNCMNLTSGDYNNDGQLDIATCGSGIASVLFGLGNGQFATAVTYTLPGAQAGYGILSIDMNNDLNLDLVICEGVDRIYVLYGAANGTFLVSPLIYSTGSGSMPWSVTAADFNADGKIDFATANPVLNNVSILLNGVKPNITVSANSSNICIGSGINLLANGANTYSWSTSDTTSVNYQMPISTNTYTVIGTGINYCVNTQTITVNVNNTCADVWPGDANSDGTADNLDVLELGLHYTQTGVPRASISNTWQSYFANNWIGTISNGKNLNHSDCNGDGTIDVNDTIAIFNNYGLTHAFKPTQINIVNQLSIVPDQAYVTKGNWGTASIYAGDAVTSITNINGLAFTVDFDNSLFETNNIYIEYQNSFLNAGQNLHFRKLDFANGKVYTATTHTNNINVSGNGLIAKLHYQIKSNLTTDEVLNIGLSQANQSNASGVITPLTTGTGTLMAIGASVGLQELNGNNISVSPNPTNGSLTVYSKTELQKIEVISITGQVLLSETSTNVSHTVQLDNFANGIYFVNFYQNNRIVKREKVVLNK